MRSFLKRRPSPALVISLVALFCSLGGVSYGLATGSIDSREIKNNTVRSKDIRNNTVRSGDVRNNTVRSRDVRDFSLLAQDFMPGQLPAGPRGAQGAQGPRGPQGPTGPSGAEGFVEVAYNSSGDVPLPANGSASAFAECFDGFLPVGGGASVFDTLGTPDLGDDVEITNAEMDLNRSDVDFTSGVANAGWSVTVSNATAETDRVLVASVSCVNPDLTAFSAAPRSKLRRQR
jgi:hypothetical protein